MTIYETLQSRRDEVLRIAAGYGANRVRVFGSAARGDGDDNSDIDLLVDLEPGRTLLDLGGLLMDLEACLGRPVDVVTENGLRERIKARVMREAVPL